MQLKPRIHLLDDGNIDEEETEGFEENDKETDERHQSDDGEAVEDEQWDGEEDERVENSREESDDEVGHYHEEEEEGDKENQGRHQNANSLHERFYGFKKFKKISTHLLKSDFSYIRYEF